MALRRTTATAAARGISCGGAGGAPRLDYCSDSGQIARAVGRIMPTGPRSSSRASSRSRGRGRVRRSITRRPAFRDLLLAQRTISTREYWDRTENAPEEDFSGAECEGVCPDAAAAGRRTGRRQPRGSQARSILSFALNACAFLRDLAAAVPPCPPCFSCRGCPSRLPFAVALRGCPSRLPFAMPLLLLFMPHVLLLPSSCPAPLVDRP
jgi:hypothetical protein